MRSVFVIVYYHKVLRAGVANAASAGRYGLLTRAGLRNERTCSFLNNSVNEAGQIYALDALASDLAFN